MYFTATYSSDELTTNYDDLEYLERVLDLSESSNYVEDYDSSSNENILSQCLSTLKNWFPNSEKAFNQDESESSSFFGRRKNAEEQNNCVIRPPEPKQLRTRRNIDPIENLEDFSLPAIHSKLDYVRVKRTAQAELRSLKQQYTRCNREAGQNCGKIYNRYNILVKEVNEKFQNFAKDFKMQDSNDDSSSDEGYVDKKKTKVDIKNGHIVPTTETLTVGPNQPTPISQQPTSLEPRPNKPEPVKFDWQGQGDEKKSTAFPTTVGQITTASLKTTSQQERIELAIDTDPRLPSVELLKEKGNQFAHRIGKTYFGDGFYYTYQGDEKFHEDLIDDHHEIFRNYEDFQGKSMQKSQFQTDSQHNTDKSSINVAPQHPQNAPFGWC